MYCISELVCGLLLNLSRSGHRSGPTAKHWYPVPRVVSLLQGDRVNRWLGLLLSEPIPSAREMEDPGKKSSNEEIKCCYLRKARAWEKEKTLSLKHDLNSRLPRILACSRRSDSKARRSDGGQRVKSYAGKEREQTKGVAHSFFSLVNFSPALFNLNAWNTLAEYR